MLVEAEDSALAVGPLVGADALERADAVVQRVRQDVHLRLREGNEGSVEPDLVDRLELAATCGHIHCVAQTRSRDSESFRVGEGRSSP